MKIRNGFVSNSSSSSFLIALPKSDYTPDSYEMYKLLFGEKKVMSDGEIDAIVCYDRAFDKAIIAEVVAKDLEDKKYIGQILGKEIKQNKDWFDRLVTDIIYFVQSEFFEDGYFFQRQIISPLFESLLYGFKVIGQSPEYPGHDTDKSKAVIEKEWQLYRTKRTRWENKAKKIVSVALKDFFKQNSDKYDFYTTEYSDNDGALYTTLEHGNIFANQPHIRFSHH